ncbi:MAG: hypothetical protein ACFFDI_18440 [Promethearchaeota archaeon]
MNNEKKKVISSRFLIPIVTTVILALLILVTNTTALSLFGGTINAPQPSATDTDISEGDLNGTTSTLPLVTDIIGAATTAGRFIEDVYAFSEDKKFSIYIPAGTIGLTKDRKPLIQISVSTYTVSLEPPENSRFIGPIYNVGPEGAIFYPDITVYFICDPDELPAGVKEEDLAIVMYNKATDNWVKLKNIKVSHTTYTITGETNYFATFGIIAYSN